MCLSTVYRNEKSEENILMSNVKELRCQGQTLLLTDLMERQLAVEGRLVCADLVEGWVLIEQKVP